MTGEELYDLALQLLGYKNADGTDNADCDDLKNRAVGLINILLAENLTLDRMLRQDSTVMPTYIDSLEDKLHCHGRLIRAVLSYGLAALLVGEEDGAVYGIMRDKYLSGAKKVEEEAVGVRHGITDCYAYNG